MWNVPHYLAFTSAHVSGWWSNAPDPLMPLHESGSGDNGTFRSAL